MGQTIINRIANLNKLTILSINEAKELLQDSDVKKEFKIEQHRGENNCVLVLLINEEKTEIPYMFMYYCPGKKLL
jgi:hypothetical protein